MADVRALEDLQQLADVILSSATCLKAFLTQNNIPPPSFDVNAPLGFPEGPPDVQNARSSLLDASKKINQLVQGPIDHIIWMSGVYNDSACFRHVCHHDIASAIPIDDDISYKDLSAATKTDEDQTRRIIRYLMSSNIFKETRPGYVTHTAGSKLLTIPGPKDMVSYATIECLPMAANMLEAHQKWGMSEEPNETAFNMATGSDLPVFKEWDKDPVKGGRFARAMSALQATPGYNITHTVNGFDWASLPASAAVVDVGGSIGQVTNAVASATPNLQFIVQDLPNVIADAKSTALPPELASRISFEAHDFFTPQPVKGAEIYLLRFILHDYSDKYAEQILRSIVPAMKPGHSRLLIMDQVMPPVGALSAHEERMLRFMDIQMMMMFNAKERELDQWAALFRKASDGKLKLVNTTMPEGSAMAIMELFLEE